MYLNLKLTSKLKLFLRTTKLVLFCMFALLSSCAQRIDNNTSNSNNNDAALFEEADVLTIANPGTVPVFNDSKTSIFLALNNYTDKTITNISYQVDDHVHVDPLNPDTHTTITNAERACAMLPPHSSCKIDYTGPLLTSGKLDATADHFSVKYQIDGIVKTTSAVIGYKLVYNDVNSQVSQILPMGSPTFMSGTNGTRSAMLYYYVSGKNPVSLKHAGFKVKSFAVVNKNFRDDSSVSPGMILTYQVASDYHHNKTKEAYLLDNSIAGFSLAYLNNKGLLQTIQTNVTNSPLYINGSYILLSPISTINSKSGNSTTFSVYNVGNQPANVTLTGSDTFSLSTNSLSIPANGSQVVSLTVTNIGVTDISASVAATASGSNTVTQPVTIIGGANLLLISQPINVTLQNYVPQTVTITITNSPSSAGNIKLANSAPVQVVSIILT